MPGHLPTPYLATPDGHRGRRDSSSGRILSPHSALRERVAADPGVLPFTPLAVHEGSNSPRCSAGSRVQGAGERESRAPSGVGGAWEPGRVRAPPGGEGRVSAVQAWGCRLRAGRPGREVASGSRDHGAPDRLARLPPLSGQNKRCSRAAVASGQRMAGGVSSILYRLAL